MVLGPPGCSLAVQLLGCQLASRKLSCSIYTAGKWNASAPSQGRKCSERAGPWAGRGGCPLSPLPPPSFEQGERVDALLVFGPQSLVALKVECGCHEDKAPFLWDAGNLPKVPPAPLQPPGPTPPHRDEPLAWDRPLRSPNAAS